MTRGWFGFRFKKSKDTSLILNQCWFLDGGSFNLKRWQVRFDSTQEYFCLCHLGVLLPGLPLHLWNEKSLEAIGNALDRVIKFEKQALVTSDKKLAKVLVEIDIHSRLLESLDIVWRGHCICQKLDYLGIPFRCSFCRQTGHLRKHCPSFVEEEQLKDTMLNLSTRVDSPRVDSQVLKTFLLEAQGYNE